MNSRWSGIFIGSIIVTALESMLIFLGIGIGPLVFPFEHIGNEWKWVGVGMAEATYLAVSLGLAFFAGGAIASRMHTPKIRGEVCFQGLATWGTASLVGLIVGGFLLATALGKVQQGAEGVAMLESLHQTKPRIITDFSVLKGKALTTLDVGVTPKQLVELAKEEAASPKAKAAAEKARVATSALSLASFLGMLIAMLSSVGGAWVGRPNEPVNASASFRSRVAA